MLTFVALQFGGNPEHRAVDGSAIVIAQFDDACLDDEPTELDQTSGTLATFDLPGAHVMPSPSRLPAIAGCPVALERREGCAQMPE